MTRQSRIKEITVEEFKRLLAAKLIRPASLDDCYGTHHKRNLYRHPNTKQFFVAVK